jgi:hypothetical protein
MKKTITFSFRCDEQFKNAIEKHAEHFGVSVGDVVRGCVKKGFKLWKEEKEAEKAKENDMYASAEQLHTHTE